MNSDSKFDVDLAKAKIREGELFKLFENKKLELKTDYIWQTSGNIAVEYKCNGKPSGIAVTEADMIVFELQKKDQQPIRIFYETEHLKKIARLWYKRGMRMKGGDNQLSEFVLIPVEVGYPPEKEKAE